MSQDTKVLFIQRVFAHYRKPITDKVSELYNIQSFGTSLDLGIKKGKASYYRNVNYLKYHSSNSALYFFLGFKFLYEINLSTFVNNLIFKF